MKNIFQALTLILLFCFGTYAQFAPDQSLYSGNWTVQNDTKVAIIASGQTTTRVYAIETFDEPNPSNTTYKIVADGTEIPYPLLRRETAIVEAKNLYIKRVVADPAHIEPNETDGAWWVIQSEPTAGKVYAFVQIGSGKLMLLAHLASPQDFMITLAKMTPEPVYPCKSGTMEIYVDGQPILDPVTGAKYGLGLNGSFLGRGQTVAVKFTGDCGTTTSGISTHVGIIGYLKLRK